jgi:hypothetical protein
MIVISFWPLDCCMLLNNRNHILESGLGGVQSEMQLLNCI